jgi:uncharacterized membrane protein YidH (DUF202 family)
MKVVGVLLIVLGIAALVYGSISYTTEKKAVDMGSIRIEKKEHHTIPLPPLIGVVLIAGGGALLFVSGRGR